MASTSLFGSKAGIRGGYNPACPSVIPNAQRDRYKKPGTSAMCPYHSNHAGAPSVSGGDGSPTRRPRRPAGCSGGLWPSVAFRVKAGATLIERRYNAPLREEGWGSGKAGHLGDAPLPLDHAGALSDNSTRFRVKNGRAPGWVSATRVAWIRNVEERAMRFSNLERNCGRVPVTP